MSALHEIEACLMTAAQECAEAVKAMGELGISDPKVDTAYAAARSALGSIRDRMETGDFPAEGDNFRSVGRASADTVRRAKMHAAYDRHRATQAGEAAE